MTTAREAELALLIAEQELDDSRNMVSQRHASLDRPPPGADDLPDSDPAGATDLFGAPTDIVRAPAERRRRITDKDIAYMKYLYHKAGWTQTQIAVRLDRHIDVVQRCLRRPHHNHRGGPVDLLIERRDIAVHMYGEGARLIDIASSLYQECGYTSPQSCYQQLRRLFHEWRVPLRTSNLRHGRLSQSASRSTREAYWREQNECAARRKQSQMRHCTASTREGRRCSRWARQGTTLCNVHAGLSGGPRRWTHAVVIAAIREWRTVHGCYPRCADWRQAAPNHPSFKTVYDLFGSWTSALAEAA